MCFNNPELVPYTQIYLDSCCRLSIVPGLSYRDDAVCRVLLCLCTRAGWFKHLEPLRTYTNHTITERARCVGTTPN